MNPEHDTAPHPARPDEPAAPLAAALVFDAGKGSETKATHGSIEAVLETAGFKQHQIRVIYYGNWLRDYSQLLDPKLVRPASAPKNFPKALSREALTQIVDVLAVREFIDLMEHDREQFRVTPDKLGVYRPSEHLDNPHPGTRKRVDFKKIDEAFEAWIAAEDPLLHVAPDTSMKNYIQRSVDFMSSAMNNARMSGPESVEGLRDFGSALHVLEDFFAHSNFVELSLIKLGYTHVLPWTSRADCKHGLPLVTGTFSGSDVIASLAAPLAAILFSTDGKPFEATRSGVRYERDRIIQILLSEHPDQDWNTAHEAFLSGRDTWAKLPFAEQTEKIFNVLGTPGKIVGNAVGTALQGMTTLLGNSVDDVQTVLGADPNTSGSTDPSHSQLAKDHAEHPLHGLAALLAQHAVLSVGKAMLAQWHTAFGGRDPAQVAANYFTHPMDSSWQDALVRDWAIHNHSRVKAAGNKSELSHLHLDVRDNAMKALRRLDDESDSFLKRFSGIKSPADLWNLITDK